LSIADLISLVSKSAPSLGLALGGPMGGVVGGLIASAFGADQKDHQEIIQKINSDPEAALKLRSIEYQHQQTLAQINAQNYLTEVDDRKNARQRQIELKDHVPEILACSFTLIYVIIQYFVLKHPGGQDDVISARVQDIMVMIISFYFGSAHKRRMSINGN
jgi:hypothetical protein